jgi:hypothetical protein
MSAHFFQRQLNLGSSDSSRRWPSVTLQLMILERGHPPNLSRLRKVGIVLPYILYIQVVGAPIIGHTHHGMLIVPFLAMLADVSFVPAWRSLKIKNQSAPSRKIVASGIRGGING